MTLRGAADGMKQSWQTLPVVWRAVITIGVVYTAGWGSSATVSARVDLPTQNRAAIVALQAADVAHMDSIRAHSVRMDVMARIQVDDRESLDDIKCYVRALARAPGAPSVDDCALRERSRR